MRWGHRRRTVKSRATRVLTSLVGIIILCVLIYTQLRPAVQYTAEYQARLFAQRVLNQAVLEQLDSENLTYGEIIRLRYNEVGDIVAIESDMARINRLKVNVNRSVIYALDDMGTANLRIPLGTLLGNEITAGRGPLVEIRVYPIGYVQTHLYSRFTEAGINQTLHQIMLGTSVRMRAVVPGYAIQADVSTSYGLAETVIVGNIPEAYARLNFGSVPALARIGS